jgi:acyl dehydratase
MNERCLDDFSVGDTFDSGTVTVPADQIVAFAREFDPQPFHLGDDDAARGSVFGGLAASGWHTAAVTMRLLVTGALRPAGGIVGAGADELRWSRPVRPGDTLRARSEVLEAHAYAATPAGTS